jgi:hypothetical protein
LSPSLRGVAISIGDCVFESRRVEITGLPQQKEFSF